MSYIEIPEGLVKVLENDSRLIDQLHADNISLRASNCNLREEVITSKSRVSELESRLEKIDKLSKIVRNDVLENSELGASYDDLINYIHDSIIDFLPF